MTVDPDSIDQRVKTVDEEELEMLEVNDEQTTELAETANIDSEVEEMLNG